MDKAPLLGLIGLARKAGKIEVGEEPVSIAARTHKARLILLACDAAENTLRRGDSLGETGNCPALVTDLTKAELGGAVGRTSCAVLAFTDTGLAAAAAKKLNQLDPDRYGQASQRLDHKAEKTLRRQRERKAKEKAVEKRQKKPWAPPPAGKKKT
jgi:ribosomal protein L7Ae-like RNA K-turn-binding protein